MIDQSELMEAWKTSRSSGIGKVLRSPARVTTSKVLELYARIRRQALPCTARTFWGGDMAVVLPEPVSTTIYRYGFFEMELTRMVLSLVSPGMTFFDVGSHFGYFSLLAAKLVGASGSVHAFEPTPSTFEVLSRNMKDQPNVRLNHVAAYSEEGTLQLKDYGLRYSAFNSLAKSKLGDDVVGTLNPQMHAVPAITIDAYVAQTGARPSFIKIDAENAELAILRGMPRTLAEVRPTLTLEVGDYGEKGGSESSQLVQYLVERGYEPWQFREGQIVRHEPAATYQYDNLLFRPR